MKVHKKGRRTFFHLLLEYLLAARPLSIARCPQNFDDIFEPDFTRPSHDRVNSQRCRQSLPGYPHRRRSSIPFCKLLRCQRVAGVAVRLRGDRESDSAHLQRRFYRHPERRCWRLSPVSACSRSLLAVVPCSAVPVSNAQ